VESRPSLRSLENCGTKRRPIPSAKNILGLGILVAAVLLVALKTDVLGPIAALPGYHDHTQLDRLFFLLVATVVALMAIIVRHNRVASRARRLSYETQQAYQESERRFRDLFENSPDAIFLEDMTGQILDANAAACALHEMTREELLSKNASDLGSTGVQGVRVRVNEPTRRNTPNRYLESFSLTKSGRKIPVEIRWNTITFKNRQALLIHVRDIEQRRRAHAALQQSELRYRSLVETARDTIFTLTTSGKINSLNPAFEVVTGWSRGEWLGRGFGDILHPEDVDRAVHLFQKTLRGETSMPYELRVQTRNGKYLWGEFVISPLHDNGELIAVLGIARDITRRKEAEDALRRSEMWLGTVFEASRDGIVVEYEERMVFTNRAFARILGYGHPLELAGKDISFVLADEDRNRTLEFGKMRLRGEPTPHTYEFNGKKADGTAIPLEASVSISTIDGKRYIIAVVRDIEDRMKAERIVRESELKFRTLAETTASAIMIYTDERFLYVNPAAERLTGYTIAEAQTMSPFDITAAADKERVINTWNARKRGESVPSHSEYRISTRQGEERWVDCTGAVITYEGKVAGLSTAFDITDRKRAELERNLLIEELQEALTNVKTLSGLLPICSSCKNIRDDKGYWHRVEAYIKNNSNADFTHGICPDCLRKLYPEFADQVKQTPTTP
jgi:PAS domain S-box-containing protein